MFFYRIKVFAEWFGTGNHFMKTSGGMHEVGSVVYFFDDTLVITIKAFDGRGYANDVTILKLGLNGRYLFLG
jgi:hypothetical protein